MKLSKKKIAEANAYLDTLDSATRDVVMARMMMDILARPHTQTGGICDPPCSGAGGTPYGYWSCIPPCRWIPELGG